MLNDLLSCRVLLLGILPMVAVLALPVAEPPVAQPAEVPPRPSFPILECLGRRPNKTFQILGILTCKYCRSAEDHGEVRAATQRPRRLDLDRPLGLDATAASSRRLVRPPQQPRPLGWRREGKSAKNTPCLGTNQGDLQLAGRPKVAYMFAKYGAVLLEIERRLVEIYIRVRGRSGPEYSADAGRRQIARQRRSQPT